MDDQPNSNAEFSHSSTSNPESALHASGMFSDSRQFKVTGGTFTNITKNYAAAPSLPSDFRMIPMGDIDLRHQIRVDERRGIVNYNYPPHRRACARRVHSAKARIDGRKSRVTVAMYQGDGAEEEWRQDTAKYMSMRHPNIVQICGAASSNGIHATLFNDDLIPLQEVLDRHRGSHFSTVYVYACCNQDFTDAFSYILFTLQLGSLSTSDCMPWIRCSTGRLCTELTPTGNNSLSAHLDMPECPGSSIIYPLSACAETITAFIDSLTLEQYHDICTWNLRQYRHFDLSASTTVNFEAVFHCSGGPLEDSVEIAFLPSAEAPHLGDWRISGGGTREVMPHGWTRFESGDVFNNTLSILFSIYPNWKAWLSQANHILRCLHITANFEDCVVVDNIWFNLNILPTMADPPEGFLFLCPQEDFRTGSSSFRLPTCTAYWSLDPSGVDCLSPEDATRLGFPSFVLTTRAYIMYWDSSVYEGLRQFHQAKGFDPYSQDIAHHFGHPLYQLSSQRDAPMDSDGEDFDADVDSDCNSAYAEDDESEYPAASAGDNSDVDAESSHSKEDVHDSTRRDTESKQREESNCKNHDASESTVEQDMVAEMPVPSLTFRIVLYIQLMLILFLALSGVHDHV